MSNVAAVVIGFACGLLVMSVVAHVTRQPDRPHNPPAPPRLVPIGGCCECGAPVGSGHTGYCSKSAMRSGVFQVVTEADCRHLTIGDMGMD